MKKLVCGMSLAVVVFWCVCAQAADFDYFGRMQYHNDVLQFNFSVDTSDTRTFFSSSWDDGGFDPMLGLWSSTGNLIHFQDDGHSIGSTNSNTVSYDHGNYDSYYSVFLDPGDYILTLTAFSSFNNGNLLSLGFEADNEAPIEIAGWDQPATGVVDDFYAFHILNVTSAVGPDPAPVATPEPSTFVLLAGGLLGLAAFARRRNA